MDNLSLFYLIFNQSGKNIWLDYFMIFGAEFVIFIAIFLVFFLSLKKGIRERRSLLLIFLAIPVGFLIIKIIRLFVFEQRPYMSLHLSPLISYYRGLSFPSTHTTIMSIIAFVFISNKSKWGLLFIFFLLWVAYARIYSGLHYPVDILGGFLVGLISLLSSKQIVKFLKIKFLIS